MSVYPHEVVSTQICAEHTVDRWSAVCAQPPWIHSPYVWVAFAQRRGGSAASTVYGYTARMVGHEHRPLGQCSGRASKEDDQGRRGGCFRPQPEQTVRVERGGGRYCNRRGDFVIGQRTRRAGFVQVFDIQAVVRRVHSGLGSRRCCTMMGAFGCGDALRPTVEMYCADSDSSGWAGYHANTVERG